MNARGHRCAWSNKSEHPASLTGLAHESCEPNNPFRVNVKLRRHFKMIWVVQSLARKYSAFAVGQISSTSSAHLIPQ